MDLDRADPAELVDDRREVLLERPATTGLEVVDLPELGNRRRSQCSQASVGESGIGAGSRSSTVTDAPVPANFMAAVRPVGPPPTTTTFHMPTPRGARPPRATPPDSTTVPDTRPTGVPVGANRLADLRRTGVAKGERTRRSGQTTGLR